MYEGIYFVDIDRKITFWNQGAERISGFTKEEAVGKHCFNNFLNHVDGEGNQLCFNGCPLHKTLMDGNTRETVVHLHHKEGHRIPVRVRTIPIKEDERIVGCVEVFVSEAEQVKVLEDLELYKEIAYRDQLTTLPNRRYLEHYLKIKDQEHLELAHTYGVAFLDIDHFKHVNDTYGHDVGDEVLKMVSRTIKAAVRTNDVIGRWGGEEFIAIFSLNESEQLRAVGEKIRMLVEKSVLRTTGEGLSVTISIGVSMVKTGERWQDVVKRADECLYKAKSNGRNQVSEG